MTENKNSTIELLRSSLNKVELHKVTDQFTCMGTNYHISITGNMPSMLELEDIEEESLDLFMEETESRYEYNPKNHFEWNTKNRSGVRKYTNCYHFKGGITLCRNAPDAVQLIYDDKSDQEVVIELKKFIQNLTGSKDEPQIGIIQTSPHGLHVRFNPYKLYEHDLSDYLGEETITFKEEMITKLKKSGDSGLYLLYGRPGTGKTSFIKHILSQLKKQALYISPAFVDSLTSPDLITLLLRYPDSILVIEDAESALMERKADNTGTVSNLLNLSDGILADFLSMNIICTFNTELEKIDRALLREGRLKGIHEFNELPPENVKKIASLLGKQVEDERAMTLAQVCNSKINFGEITRKAIGFGE